MTEGILEDIKKREKSSHKYDNGHLLVVGGSEKYSGSPALNSLSAYRSGVDLVTTVSPKRSADIVAGYSPSIITVPLGGGSISPAHYEKIEKLLKNVDALVIGGGLGRENQTNKTVIKIIEHTDIPAVIDADAIRALADDAEVLKKDMVVTPHRREFEVLTDMEASKDNAEEAAQELGCTVLLKGKKDIITDGDETHVNETGNEYMTVGGTGDTLAGIAGSLLAQKIEPFKAAYGAAWINGKAGELAAEEKGVGLMPDDVLEKISEAIDGEN